jgi:hypothetical protein
MRAPDIHPARNSRDATVRVAAAAVAAAAAVLALVLFIASNPGHSTSAVTTGPGPHSHASSATQLLQADLTIRSRETPTNVPRSFLGLSTEYWTLPVDERHIHLYTRVLSLIHVPGDGRFVLRIGGDSSDHTFYDPRLRKLPRWAFELTHAFVSRTARIVREMKLSVVLDLNLVTGTPLLAGAWARDAEAQMPTGSIIGFEIGNEPDLYDRAFWFFAADEEKFTGLALPSDMTPSSYARDFNWYARALSQVAPHVPLLAPALANPYADLSWISTLLAGPHSGLGVISGHRYPYSACAFADSPEYATIDRVLSENATAGMAQTVRPAVRLAYQAGLPFRLTELNSVTCGGLAGVSNAFATALWAPDAAFELIRAGVQGINLHARVFAINDPFTFDRRGLLTRPLLYGLILFARTLGPDSRLIPVQLYSDGSLHLKAWAVKVGKDALHVLLIDKGPRLVRVTLNLPATGAATIERLLARSASSRSGVTLGGQHLDQDGKWQGKFVREVVMPRDHRYRVALPQFSAALVTVHIPPGSLG